MTNAKQVLDVQVSKGITTAQSNEHLRNRSEKAAEYAMKKGNYDPTREHLNFEIVNGKVRPVDKSRSIPDRMADSLRQRGIKDPNEGLQDGGQHYPRRLPRTDAAACLWKAGCGFRARSG